MNIQKIVEKIAADEKIEATQAELEALGHWWIEDDGVSLDNIEDEYSGPIWGSSRHTLYCGDTIVAEWEVEGCGCYGPDAAPSDEWGMESVNSRSTISDAAQSLLDILSLDDPDLEIPEPESPPDNPDPEGEWELWWVTTPTKNSYLVARYATQEEALAIRDSKERELKAKYPGELACGFSVTQCED